MRSLRQRAVVSGVLIAVVSILIGGAALYIAFDSVAQSQFNNSLLNRQFQVIAALEKAGPSQVGMSELLPDPAYSRPYSGSYWEVTGPKNQLVISRSLFDGALPKPSRVPRQATLYDAHGPERPVRVAARSITLSNGEDWQIFVARSFDDLNAERATIRRSLLMALGIIGLIGIVGSLGQTAAVLRPLGALRSDLLKNWQGAGKIDVQRYPMEVRPLVAEINDLLERNRSIIDRTRRQGADLAHALKTPSSILRNELEQIRSGGHDTSTAEAALERIDAQIRRSLARVRAVAPVGPNAGQTTIIHSTDRLIRLFRSVAGAERFTFKTSVEPDLKVGMDPEDLEEALGNLIDNAMKWGRSQILLTAHRSEGATLVEIEDDGPGIANDDVARALHAGGRIDTSTPGTGLGLAIAADLVQIYRGTISLSRSTRLGGLNVTLRFDQ